MLTKDEITNILFFLNGANITGQQAITMAVLQTKLSNMLKIEEATDPKLEEKPVENNNEEKK